MTRPSWRTSRGQAGYALASVLFLIVVLSVLSVIILKGQLFRREEALRIVGSTEAIYAADNGIDSGLSLLDKQNDVDTSYSLAFFGGSTANVTIFPWGLFAGIESVGHSIRSRVSRCAIIGSQLSESDSAALVIANLQHGLTLAGKSRIIGNVVVGPRGASIGNLKDEIPPISLPINGRVEKEDSTRHIFSTFALDSQIQRIEPWLLPLRRPRMDYSDSPSLVVATGYLDLSELSDSIDEVFSPGNLMLGGTAMKRGPPLNIVVIGNVGFMPGTSLVGFISICSTDSISIPPQTKLANCIVASEKSISVQAKDTIAAQLFAPVIRCAQHTLVSYPSICVSVNLSDSSGIPQMIRLESGARLLGSLIMETGSDISLTKTVIDLEPGSVVTGEVYTNGYLTMDGTVNGAVRTFDLYFYESPSIYLGWLRKGIIDRKALPNGFLRPLGVLVGDKAEVLTWL